MKSVKKYLRIFIVIITVFIMFYIFLETFEAVQKNDRWKDESFNLSINGKNYGDIDIEQQLLPHLKKNDEVVISKKVDSTMYRERTLVFRTYSCTVDVFSHGKNIYSYGMETFEKGNSLGRGFHMIQLNKNDQEIIIKLKAGEDLSYMWLDFFKTTLSNHIWRDILNRNLFAVYLSLLLLLIGMIGVIGCIFIFVIEKNSNLHLLYSFETAFFVGLWNSCTCGLFQMLTEDYELISFFEYASIYIASFFYLSTIEVIREHARFRNLISYMKYVCFIFIVGTSTLHFTGLFFITKTIAIYRVITIVILIIIFITVVTDYKSQKKFEKALSISNIIAVVLMFIHALLLNLNVLYVSIGGTKIMLDNVLTSIAMLIVIITPLFSYALKVSEIGTYETQISLLKNIAYKDQLTGLDNRYSGMAFVMELKKDKIPYFIIMYDLNNLKYVNDNFGHDRGDKLITDFSECLQTVFNTEHAINIRYGGDEFITIAKSFEVEVIEAHIDRVKLHVEEINKNNNDAWLSVAIGMASSEELEDDSYDSVLKLADARMYKNKLSMKVCRL